MVSEVKRGRGRPALGDAAKRNRTWRFSPDVIEGVERDPRSAADIMRAGLRRPPE